MFSSLFPGYSLPVVGSFKVRRRRFVALNLACYDIECYTKVRRTPDDNIKIAPPTDFKHTTVSTYLVNKIETKNEKIY